ncbi:IS982 family transposase [Candidatus Dependentiae bacterium]|nr:IS982 family transposase [Candidatus Dependentiae bacterium]
MEAEAIIAYVVSDDTLKLLNIIDDKQSVVSTAEIMTMAIISALFYAGNIEKARKALHSPRYISNMLSKSQLNRRLHKISPNVWNAVLERFFNEAKNHDMVSEFVADSFPLPACKLVRQRSTKLYTDKSYLGYCAVRQEFFLGFKLHMICDVFGHPKQMLFLPASTSDIAGLRAIDLQLPKNSALYADKAYNDYCYEDRLIQEKQIHLMPIRKKNSVRKGGGHLAKIRQRKRKIIETAFSCIEKLLPRSIHAVTIAGFILKSTLFVVAYALTKAAF